MTNDQREQAIAAHVEALVQLGWRWEGRGLIPTIGATAGNTAADRASIKKHNNISNCVDTVH